MSPRAPVFLINAVKLQVCATRLLWLAARYFPAHKFEGIKRNNKDQEQYAKKQERLQKLICRGEQKKGEGKLYIFRIQTQLFQHIVLSFT